MKTIWEFVCTWGMYGCGMVVSIAAFALPLYVLFGGDLAIIAGPNSVGFVWFVYFFVAMFAYTVLMIIGDDCESKGRYRFAIATVFLFGLLAEVHLILLARVWTIWISLVLTAPVALMVVGLFLHEMCELEKLTEKEEAVKYEQTSTA